MDEQTTHAGNQGQRPAGSPEPGARSTGTTDGSETERPVVVVTGGSGLIGSALIGRLLRRYRVVSVDLDGDPSSSASVEFVCTDLTDRSSVERAFQRIGDLYGNHIASVVHLAAYYDFAGRDSPLYDRVTVEGTRRLLDTVQAFELEQFVFSSTMLVHRATEPGRPLSEDDEIRATWPYPESKVETEQVLREHPLAERVQMSVARLAGVYDGNGHSPPITNQIKRIDGRWVTSHFYPAGLDRGQAFVHRDDAVDALLRLVDRRRDLPSWFPVLIGEPDTPGYRELQDAIAHRLHGRSWPTWRIPAPLARFGAWVRERNPLGEDPFIRSWMVDRASDHYELDIDVARTELGWQPQHRLLDEIPEMVDGLRRDRDGWYSANGLRPPRQLLPV